MDSIREDSLFLSTSIRENFASPSSHVQRPPWVTILKLVSNSTPPQHCTRFIWFGLDNIMQIMRWQVGGKVHQVWSPNVQGANMQNTIAPHSEPHKMWWCLRLEQIQLSLLVLTFVVAAVFSCSGLALCFSSTFINYHILFSQSLLCFSDHSLFLEGRFWQLLRCNLWYLRLDLSCIGFEKESWRRTRESILQASSLDA